MITTLGPSGGLIMAPVGDLIMACSLVGDLIMAPGSTSSRVGTIMARNVVQMIMTQSSTGSRLIGMIMACSLVDIIVTPTNARSLITAAIRDPPRSLVDIVVTPLMDRRTGKQDTPRSLVDIVVTPINKSAIRRYSETIVVPAAETFNMVVSIMQ